MTQRGAAVKFSVALFVFQVVVIVLFGVFVEYDGALLPPKANTTQLDNIDYTSFYPMFQDVHVMIFLGIGFLITFLKKYSYSGVGYNFLIGCVVLEWATLVRGLLANNGSSTVYLNIAGMIGADFTAGTILISFGAVLGKIGRLQLLIFGILEVVFASVNEVILFDHLRISDVGGSMTIHCFAAYFGLAVARVLYKPSVKGNDKEGSSYQSDLFSMVGTVFLWAFWPSFNSAVISPSSQQHRAVINTYYSLSACCITVFTISPLINKKNKLDMVHIQNATLAGGVAVGTAADMILYPWGACLVGVIGGAISTLGFTYVTPFLCDKLKIHDTCGINNLHGMPAIFAAITGAVAASRGNTGEIWNKDQLSKLHFHTIFPAIKDGRSTSKQGAYQAYALLATIAMSVAGGIITGFILKLPIFDEPMDHQLYDDEDYWELPADDRVFRITPLNANTTATVDTGIVEIPRPEEVSGIAIINDGCLIDEADTNM